MDLRVTFRLLGALLLGTVLSASACRGERADSTPPSGAPTGTGGATPSPGRDSSGMGGETPSEARDQAGVVAPTSAASGTVDGKPGASAGAGPATGGGACAQDADCGLTRIEERSCCDGCEERALLRSEITALEERCREQNERCPARACAPGRRMVTPVCRQGRCEVSLGGR